MQRRETPILIVGGGAAGMALACDLGYRGVECMVVEQGTGEIITPKTGHISARTMEHCRRWGFAEDVRNAGFPRDLPLDTVLCTSLAGYELTRKPTPSINDTRPLPSSPENRLRCPQMLFDPLLAVRAQDHDCVTARFNWRFSHFEVDDRSGEISAFGVDAQHGEEMEVRAKYLIGADGANSTVRRQLGVGMTGRPLLNYSLIVLFRCPNFFSYHDKGPAERYTFIGPDGWQGNYTAVNGDDLWRLSVRGQDHHFDLERFDARRAVLDGFGRDDVEFEVELVQPWKCTELVADDYVVGNVILAGDAAHTMSPTGGFGMNTAIDDSVNLGWKLWAIESGWGGPELLESYHEERHPIGVRNCKMASQNFDFWVEATDWSGILDDTEQGAAVRAAAAREFDEVASRIQGSEGVILGYRYEDSPICVSDGRPFPPDDYATYVPNCRPGARAPHFWIDDNRSSLDLFGREFVVMHFEDGREPARHFEVAAESLGIPLASFEIDDPDVRDIYDQTVVLVRPDGHVCYANTPPVGDSEEAGAILQTVCGAPSRDLAGAGVGHA